MAELRIDLDWINCLLPLHVIVDANGKIEHVGSTVEKMFVGVSVIGRQFGDLFEILHPQTDAKFDSLFQHARKRLKLRLKGHFPISLKAQVVPICGNEQLLVNMSFGIGVGEAVGKFGLTMGDFDPTDLTIEMLYVMEAKAAVTQELRRLNERLQGAKIAAEEQAFTDTLTGLKNRRAMDHILSRYVQRGDPFAVMHVDLDYFKQVNDTLGHAAGDAVLRRVAKDLVLHTRVEDTIFRFGGDEFVIILPRLTNDEVLKGIADRIIQGLEVPVRFEGQDCCISGSVGIATTAMYSNPDAEVMLHDADLALYASKNQGRGCATLFRPGAEGTVA